MRRPPLQLPAVVFSAGRFTPAQADASRAQNPVTANPEESILKGVGDVMSYPQRRMVEAITGTYQDPSAALGIQNPIAAFATDVVLDPTNAIPAGALAKLFGRGAKTVSKIDDVSRARNTELSRLINFDESVEKSPYLGTHNHNSVESLRTFYNSEIDRANDWSKNWYSQRSQVMEKFATNNESASPILKKIVDSNVKGTLNKLDDFTSSRLEPSAVPSYGHPVKGVSSRNTFNIQSAGFDVPFEMSKKHTFNYVKFDYENTPFLTAIHEGAHGFDFGFGVTGRGNIPNQINMARTTNRTKESINNVLNVMDADLSLEDISYLSDPAEVYARTNELRAMFGLDPNKVVSASDVQEIQTALMNLNPAKGEYWINPIKLTFGGANPNKLAQWLNMVPAAGGVAMIGNQVDQQR